MGVAAMFPLGSVLFPYTPLMLRVFEPRYLAMMAGLIDIEDPRFGVVLIARGPEAGGGEERYSTGTMAHVLQIQVDDTDLYVVARGGERITVDAWRDDDPHPVADVSAMEPLVWSDALEPLHRETERIVRRVASLASALGEARWDPGTPLSDDPVESAWQLAAIAPLGEYDRLRLLNSTSVGGLLGSTIDLCLEAEPSLIARAGDARDA